MIKKLLFTTCFTLGMLFSASLSAQQVLLEKKFDDTYLKSGTVLPDGYAVLGIKYYDKVIGGTNHREEEPFLVKLDANMQPVWEKKFARHKQTDMVEIVQGKDALFVLGAEYGKTRIVKLDLMGHQIWDRSYAFPDYSATEGSWLKLLPDGDLLVMSRAFRRENSYGDPWLQRLSAKGEPKWGRKFRPGALAGLKYPLLTENNSVMMFGSIWPEAKDLGEEISEGWVLELDLDDPNHELRNKRISQWRSQGLQEAMPLENGHYWVVGWANENSKPNVRREGILLELDAELNLVRYKKFADGRHGYLNRIAWNAKEQRLYLFGLSLNQGDNGRFQLHKAAMDADWASVEHQYGERNVFRDLEVFDNGEVFAILQESLQIQR